MPASPVASSRIHESLDAALARNGSCQETYQYT